MSEQASQQISCRIVSKPALHFIEARLPLDLIDAVNAYIDEVRDRAEDYGVQLVGQIRQNPRSAQLKLNLADQIPLSLAQIITQIGKQYVDSFNLAAEVMANDMWTIHSYAGDYNPMHDHGANTFVGLSSIVYLKVPESIAQMSAMIPVSIHQIVRFSWSNRHGRYVERLTFCREPDVARKSGFHGRESACLATEST